MTSYNESCLLVKIYKKVALNYKVFFNVFCILACLWAQSECLSTFVYVYVPLWLHANESICFSKEHRAPLYFWAVTGGKKQNECWGNGEEASLRVTIRSRNRSETRREFCLFRLLPVAFQLGFFSLSCFFLALPVCLPLHAPFWSHGIALTQSHMQAHSSRTRLCN